MVNHNPKIIKWKIPGIKNPQVEIACHSEHLPHLTTQVRYQLTSSHEEMVSTYRYFEKDNIFITFITAYCYNCSISVLVIVNLLLCLVYKVNFTIGVYGWERTVRTGCGALCDLRCPLQVLQMCPHR